MKNLKFKHNQQGVALAVGMILLLIVSIIGVTSMKSAILQEKMASGLKNRELADAASLTLLVGVEKYIYDLFIGANSVVIGSGSAYTYAPRSVESNSFRSERNLNGGFDFGSVLAVNAQFGGILDAEPQFIIEPSKDINSDLGISSSTLGEYDDNAAGISGGGNASLSSILYTYRIVTKATDTTGQVISAFESVMSIKTR